MPLYGVKKLANVAARDSNQPLILVHTDPDVCTGDALREKVWQWRSRSGLHLEEDMDDQDVADFIDWLVENHGYQRLDLCDEDWVVPSRVSDLS
ncbi:MAG TPA: hypothetical protein VJL59_23550 [Anaerolineales bacterium]|nr:hypothetical protein [Anaerolineales bacterium]